MVDFGPNIGEAYVHSPEDLILYKLQYYSLSSQPKHIRDIGSIIAMVGKDSLEHDYLAQWIDRLELNEIWQEIQEQMSRLRSSIGRLRGAIIGAHAHAR